MLIHSFGSNRFCGLLGVGVLASVGLLSCSSSSTTTQTDAGSKPSVTLDATTTFNGNLSIAGTVNFPSASSGRAIQLKVMAAPSGTPNAVGNVGTPSGSSVDYVIKGVVIGEYFVQMTVDQNGNGTFGDSGDFTGYYNGDGFGTFKPPTVSQSGATRIPVPSSGVQDAGPGQAGDNGINFALATVP